MADLPAMQRQPQPHPGSRAADLVVRTHRSGQLTGHASSQHGLGHLRPHQDQRPVTAILTVTLSQRIPDRANADCSAWYKP